LRDPLPGHRDPPVVRAVIDHEQLSSATDKYKKEKRFTVNEGNSLAFPRDATLVDRLTNRRFCASLRDDLDGNIHPNGSLFYRLYDSILGCWAETSDHPRAHRE
jgi:hypothetical protein